MSSPVRLLRAIRPVFGPVVNFAGRIAGIAVTLIVVRYTGIGPSAVPVLLALAVFAFAQAALAGPLELQVIAEVGRRAPPAPVRLLTTSLLLGAVLGALLTVGTVGLSTLPGDLDPVAGYFVPLGLALPFTSCFAAVQGIDIAHGRWMPSGVASFARTVVVVAVVASTIGSAGLLVVPLAFLLGELVRLGLLLGRPGRLGAARPGLEWGFAWRVVQQVPSSMVSSVGPTVDRLLVTTLGLGNIAVLDLAEKAAGFLNLSVAQGVIPVLYRRWALVLEPARLRAEVFRATRVILAVCAVLAVGAAVVLPPLVAAVAGVSGGDVRDSLDLTLWLLLAGFPGYVASQAVVRLMILENLQRWFNMTAVVQLSLNVLLDILLGVHFGIPGVAAATAVVWWLGLALCCGVVRLAPLPRVPAAAPAGGPA